ncbi:uncharacterized protein LOC143929648 [Lithobates pipiens]
MASQNIPSPFRKSEASQRQQKLDDEELKEEDLEYLHHLENSLLNTKDKPSDRKKKESKKHKKSKLSSDGSLGSPKLEIDDVSPVSDTSFKSSSSKKKGSQVEFLENVPPQEDSQSNKVPDPSSIKVKKEKKKKHEVNFESLGSSLQCKDVENVNLLGDSSIKSSSSKKKGKRSAPESLENFPLQENSQADKIPDLSSVKVRKEKKKTREVHFESLLPNNCSPSDQEPTPEGWSSRNKLKRHRQVESLRCSLSSPQNLPKAFLEDKTGVFGKVEDTNTVCDHSQDLFITQMKFLPNGLSSCSEESPPLGQKRQDGGVMKHRRSQNSSCEIQPLSHSLPKSEDNSCEMQDSGGNSKDKSTQTDNLFTYLSLMTYLKKVKVLEACSKKPLDLRLQSRTRAIGSRRGLVNDNEVIIIGSSPDLKASRKAIKGQIILSPPQPFDNSKFVQTILNSSYYFKGKGENDQLTPITPLLKMKKKHKKKGKKSKS